MASYSERFSAFHCTVWVGCLTGEASSAEHSLCLKLIAGWRVHQHRSHCSLDPFTGKKFLGRGLKKGSWKEHQHNSKNKRTHHRKVIRVTQKNKQLEPSFGDHAIANHKLNAASWANGSVFPLFVSIKNPSSHGAAECLWESTPEITLGENAL